MFPRPLDFLVIGTQKGGTTTLWRHLLRHPRIWMPETKEEPFFCKAEGADPGAFDAFMKRCFADAPEDMLLGKATPHYMMGSEDADVTEIARRIAEALPDVRLLALLRDPIERAASQHRMSVRRGWEQRTFEEAVRELLEDRLLEEARTQPSETNSYLVQGEYGRVLSIYRDRFPAEQIHVEPSEALDRDPGGVLDRVLEFLSLPAGFRPPRLDARLHRGGSRRLLDAESRASLLEFLEENVWPKLKDEAEDVKRRFNAFLAIWDVAPEEHPAMLEAATRKRLEAHYEADGEILGRLGFAAPWPDSWS
jgi:Sulfotransferase domain